MPKLRLLESFLLLVENKAVAPVDPQVRASLRASIVEMLGIAYRTQNRLREHAASYADGSTAPDDHDARAEIEDVIEKLSEALRRLDNDRLN